jgi:secreted Zn-dependent insulinase-like peptidase
LEVFKFLYSVDQLAQSTIFENLLDSNYTLLPKGNFFLMACFTSVQIYKKS